MKLKRATIRYRIFFIIPFVRSFCLEFSTERCAAPNLSADVVVQTFARTCYEFHVTKGENYEKAQQICKSHGKLLSISVGMIAICGRLRSRTECAIVLTVTSVNHSTSKIIGSDCERIMSMLSFLGGDLIHDFRGATSDYILSELERRKGDLRTQLVWIGVQKEPGFTSRTWKWSNGNFRFWRSHISRAPIEANDHEIFHFLSLSIASVLAEKSMPHFC